MLNRIDELNSELNSLLKELVNLGDSKALSPLEALMQFEDIGKKAVNKLNQIQKETDKFTIQLNMESTDF